MLVRRDFRHFLEVEADTYLIYIRMSREETVIIASAPSQPMTYYVEGHTRYQSTQKGRFLLCNVRVHKRNRPFCVLWLKDMKRALNKIMCTHVRTPHHRLIIEHFRQKDLLSLGHKVIEQWTDIHLVW